MQTLTESDRHAAWDDYIAWSQEEFPDHDADVLDYAALDVELDGRYPWYVAADYSECVLMAETCPAELLAWRAAVDYHASLVDASGSRMVEARLRHRRTLEQTFSRLRAAYLLLA